MRVILQNDVPKIGRRFDVKEVSDGYATNYLIPNRLAEPATPKKIAALELKKAQADEAAATRSELLHNDLQKISGKTVRIAAKANAQGHLFKGLHAGDVVAALEKEYGVQLPEAAIKLPNPIKEIGEHSLTVTLDEKTVPLGISISGA